MVLVREIIVSGLFFVNSYIYAPESFPSVSHAPAVQRISSMVLVKAHTACACLGGGCATGCCTTGAGMFARLACGSQYIIPTALLSLGLGLCWTTSQALKGLRAEQSLRERVGHRPVVHDM